MTGPQLKSMRASRKMSQAELSAFLGDSTAGTVSRWEKGMHPIPQWVEEKLLSTVTVTLPLTALQELMILAADRRMDFQDFLGNAIQAYIEKHPAPLTPTPPA